MDIAGLNFKLTRPLFRHVVRRVRRGLAPAAARVSGVMVRLRDVNGPRGGVDMGCRIAVWLRGRGTVVVDAVERDLYAAVDSAAAKLRESVRRRLKPSRTHRREYANRRSPEGAVR
jgi:ribosome-associated translation inhibitor RaiA